MNTVQECLSTLFSLRKPGEDEYINDTDKLVYCRACRTPRQTVITLPGSTLRFYPPVMCICQKEKAEREEAALEQVRFQRKVEQLKAAGLQDEMLRTYTFENDKGYTPQIKKARKYVESFDTFEKHGEGLLMWGNVGSGKTFMAGCIANALLNKGIPVLMTNFSRILLRLTGTLNEDKNAFLDSMNSYRLLIIDDLGIERSTEFALEQVFSVIDRRCRSGLPMIITTNMTLNAMKNPEDIAHARIYDRVLERCLPIKVTGDRIRQQRAAERMREFQDLLASKT